MGQFYVCEKFVSINGEAQCAGELACFIRFAGCNLDCSYCDTKWANVDIGPFEILNEEDIYSYIKETGVKNVTLTGGEPLIQKGMYELIKLLTKDKNLNIEVETNGSVDISKYISLGENLSFTLDYKLKGSGMQDKMLTDNYKYISKKDSVKFVVSNKEDLDIAKQVIDTYDLCQKTRVYISTAFREVEPREVVEYMKENKMNDVRLQLQLHKYIWNPEERGV